MEPRRPGDLRTRLVIKGRPIFFPTHSCGTGAVLYRWRLVPGLGLAQADLTEDASRSHADYPPSQVHHYAEDRPGRVPRRLDAIRRVDE
jgi:hypothetical protein